MGLPVLKVPEALGRILAALPVLPTEDRPPTAALGLVLGQDLFASEALPPFDNSAVDGYAVRLACVASATESHPIRLPLVGDVAAGHLPECLTLEPGTAVRIMTGAPVPPGTEAVVMREDTIEAPDAVMVKVPAEAGEFVRRRGEDVAPGDRLLRAGTRLRPDHVALLGAVGSHAVPVHRPARVALLATGDELVWPDQAPGPGQIRASSAWALEALVRNLGAEPVQLGIVRDHREDLEVALARAAQADLILTTGGVSVGDHDLVREVLEARGNVAFWRIDMQPGKPLAFGHLDGTPLIGLPGNPVSSLVAFELFARPAIRRLMGHATPVRPLVQARLEAGHTKRAPRRQFLRAWAWWGAQGYEVRLSARQGSHQLTGLAEGNALVVLPEGAGEWAAGDAVDVLLTDEGEAYARRDPHAE